ncbi:hypothetical protein MUP46_03330 [Patescibacteria group bacterium]|nr:hypothetical protein [Patescibacteria group bacterium]
MGVELEDKFFQARRYCIEHAAENNFDMTDPSVPDWMKVGVEKFKAGEEITPQVLQTIDLRGGDAPRS